MGIFSMGVVRLVVYGDGQSHIWGGGATGSDVTENDVTEVCSAHARIFPVLFSSYYSSTSNMATGSDQRSRDPFGVPLGVRMRNQKLGNIRPSGAFWPEVTLWNVTPSGFPWVRCAHAWSEVPLGCSLGRPCLSYSSPYHYLPLSRNFISTFNNGLHLLCSLSRPHCIFVIFSEILTFLASFL